MTASNAVSQYRTYVTAKPSIVKLWGPVAVLLCSALASPCPSLPCAVARFPQIQQRELESRGSSTSPLRDANKPHGPPCDLFYGSNTHTAASISPVSIAGLLDPMAPATLLPDPLLGHIWSKCFFE